MLKRLWIKMQWCHEILYCQTEIQIQHLCNLGISSLKNAKALIEYFYLKIFNKPNAETWYTWRATKGVVTLSYICFTLEKITREAIKCEIYCNNMFSHPAPSWFTFTQYSWQHFRLEGFPTKDRLLDIYFHNVSYNVPVRSSSIYNFLLHSLVRLASYN